MPRPHIDIGLMKAAIEKTIAELQRYRERDGSSGVLVRMQIDAGGPLILAAVEETNRGSNPAHIVDAITNVAAAAIFGILPTLNDEQLIDVCTMLVANVKTRQAMVDDGNDDRMVSASVPVDWQGVN